MGRTLAVAWLAVFAVTYVGQRWLIYPRYLVPDWADWSWPGVQRVDVRTTDGEVLKGYWKSPSRGGTVVVSFHGNGSLPEIHAGRFASMPWLAHGWGVMTVAYRGYPGSTGSPSEDGLLRDAEAALTFVREHAPDAPVLLHGHSLGAAVAVAMATRYPSVGLYLEAPFTNLPDVAAERLPVMPTSLMWDTFRSDGRIGRVRAPVMVVHGRSDVVVRPGMGRALAEVAGSGATFDMVDADHASVFGVMDARAEVRFRNAVSVPPSVSDRPGPR